ncbi:hypothetical protein BDP67DRAFT_518834 [Colletotrichum lupini]|nr:hypothetical protein BDP67DRAFT_518834 [Colletotrichum lupini]
MNVAGDEPECNMATQADHAERDATWRLLTAEEGRSDGKYCCSSRFILLTFDVDRSETLKRTP